MAIRETKITSLTLVLTTLITAITTIVVTLISSGYFKNQDETTQNKIEELKLYHALNDSFIIIKKKYNDLNAKYLEFRINNNNNPYRIDYKNDNHISSKNVITKNNIITYVKTDFSGVVTFNYSNNNGIYEIGHDEYSFQTMWTKASNQYIHVYKDYISGVALAKSKTRIEDIADPTIYDFSSRTRDAAVGNIVILKNGFDNYAILQILKILDNTRGDSIDQLQFKYLILKQK